LFAYLPESAIMHDPNAYLKASPAEPRAEPVQVGPRSRPAVTPTGERASPS